MDGWMSDGHKHKCQTMAAARQQNVAGERSGQKKPLDLVCSVGLWACKRSPTGQAINEK
jgi:hypothetical protein